MSIVPQMRSSVAPSGSSTCSPSLVGTRHTCMLRDIYTSCTYIIFRCQFGHVGAALGAHAPANSCTTGTRIVLSKNGKLYPASRPESALQRACAFTRANKTCKSCWFPVQQEGMPGRQMLCRAVAAQLREADLARRQGKRVYTSGLGPCTALANTRQGPAGPLVMTLGEP